MTTTSIDMYRSMVTGRRFEEQLAELFRNGQVYGNLHLGCGEEATAVGGVDALGPDDLLYQTHRGIAGVIHRGLPLDVISAQALGRTTGTSRGRSDVVHCADRRLGIMGVSGTIGGNFGLALGSAFASRYRDERSVTLCCFGDGAMNRGTFLESANMAVLWTAPVVFLCDNNQFAVSAAIVDMLAGAGIAERAAAFGMPSVRIDGNDVEAVRSAVADGVERARAGDGPSFVEAVTYRLRGHFEGDGQHYRDQALHEEWLGRDPITRYRTTLLDRGTVTAAQIDDIDTNVDDTVRDALKQASQAPQPDVTTVTEGVFA